MPAQTTSAPASRPALGRAQRRLVLFAALAALIALVAIVAPLVATHDPRASVLSDAIQPPSSEHLFGTDRMGRDLFSRVVFGTRTSLVSSLSLVVATLVVGGVLGTVAGYVGGVVDAVIMRVADMMVSFPGMALAIAMAGILGAGIFNAVIAIMVVSWTKYARLARSLVLKIRHQDFVLAARLDGTRERDILLRYMVPAVLPTLVITAATDVGGMMLELAGFSFLGLGAQSSSIEWGYMLNEGRAYMESAPWLMVFPGLAIFLTVVVFNLLGDAIRDVLDPRQERRVVSRAKARRKGARGAGEAGRGITRRTVVKGAVTVGVVGGVAALVATREGGLAGSSTHLDFGCYNYSDSLDPSTNVNSSWCGTRYAITECLFRFDDQVVAQHNLCDDYSHSEDYRTWTLHIRDGVRFSNGKDVNASAVVASIERLYRQTDAAQGGTGNSNPQIYMTYDDIVADDATNTVTITCTNPTGNLAGILSYPYFSIIDAEAADQGEIVGTGPYKVESVNTGMSIDMVRNDYYWNGVVPYDTVRVTFIEDSSTKAMALQSGDIDAVENVTTASDLQKLEADPAYYVQTAAGVRTGNSYMNFHGQLANAALRQAVQLAIDAETMATTTVANMYTAGYSVLPSSLAYNYDQLTNPYGYDPDRARAVLDAAGIVDADGDGVRELDGKPVSLTYVAFSSRNLNDFAEAIALQLGEVGIKVTVNVTDYDTALALQNAGEFDFITANTTTVGTGDPQDFLGGWYSGNSQSYGYYANAEYDGLYERLLVTMDSVERLEIITRLQQILIDDAATIVHGYYNSRMLSRVDSVKGAGIATIDYYWLTTAFEPVG